jgi:hypothetical protein
VLVIGDREDALERMREQIGNEWMRQNIVPHLSAPTDRITGEAVVSFERS